MTLHNQLSEPVRDARERPAREPELRRPERTDAILDATYELLGELGYDRLTVDAVAARAHASKATIYRRWRSKQDLVISAFHRGRAEPPASADAGNLRDDLLVLLHQLRAVTSPSDARAFVSLLAASQQEPTIAAVMGGQLVEAWRAECEHVMRRARERAELPPAGATMDADAVFDLIIGQVVVRSVIRGQTLDESFVHHVVDRVLLPALTSTSRSSDSQSTL